MDTTEQSTEKDAKPAITTQRASQGQSTQVPTASNQPTQASEVYNQYTHLASSGLSIEDIYTKLLAQGFSIEQITAAQEKHQSAGIATQPPQLSTSAPSSVDTQLHAVQALVIAAAAFIAIGIFSFIAANWQGMAPAIKTVVLIASISIAYGLGWYALFKRSLSKIGQALFLLSILLYGASLSLLGDAYNLEFLVADYLILWMLGSLAVSRSLGYYAFYTGSIVIGVASIIGYTSFSLDPVTYTFTSMYPSAILTLIAAIYTGYLGWRIRQQVPRDVLAKASQGGVCTS